ncbi:4347_t:CDS:2 [Entrophospora sp. SA101]|nr:4347_t:CDS:2 [Entrophospora sp. SA101]
MTSLSQVSNQELIRELKNRIKRHQTPKETNKIIILEVQKEKLIAQLDDGRKVIFPIPLLTELEILSPEIKPEQLKKYDGENEKAVARIFMLVNISQLELNPVNYSIFTSLALTEK